MYKYLESGGAICKNTVSLDDSSYSISNTSMANYNTDPYSSPWNISQQQSRLHSFSFSLALCDALILFPTASDISGTGPAFASF